MSSRIRSVGELAERVADDPQLADEIRRDPARAIADLVEPLRTDVWIYRIVVGGLASALLLSILGAITLAIFDDTDPQVLQLLIAVGSGALGAIAGLLAPPPGGGGNG